MGLFGRKNRTEAEAPRQQLAQEEPLHGNGFTLRAIQQLGGMRKRTPITVMELTTQNLTGWFHLDEARSFFTERGAILESWNNSPAELYLATAGTAGKGSPAAVALEGLSEGHAALLQPTGNGMQVVLLLDQRDLQSIRDWIEQAQ